MQLRDLTWPDVEALDRSEVVLIPTGSLEQHGPHLPVFTDSILVTAVAEAVEQRMSDHVLLTPTLWLGASAHHLAFPGTLSASFAGYQAALESVVESLIPHGFFRFYVLNGHGGNTEPNGVILRMLKQRHPELTVGHAGYFSFIPQTVNDAVLQGPIKRIRHACEAETSLMLHVRPDLVRFTKAIDDGLDPEPMLQGVIHHFDECTEQGVLGNATYARAETGKVLFEAAVDGVVGELTTICQGYVLAGSGERSND